jgi:hypothetical protein
MLREHHELDDRLLRVRRAGTCKQARSLLREAMRASVRHFRYEERHVFPVLDRALKPRYRAVRTAWPTPYLPEKSGLAWTLARPGLKPATEPEMQVVADRLDRCPPALRGKVLRRLAKHILAAKRIGRARLARRVIPPFAVHNKTVAVRAGGECHGGGPDSVRVPLHRDAPLAPMSKVAHQHHALGSRRNKLKHLFPGFISIHTYRSSSLAALGASG